MLPELSKLIEVQELDKVIQEVAGELERLPEELKTEEAALEDLKAATSRPPPGIGESAKASGGTRKRKPPKWKTASKRAAPA